MTAVSRTGNVLIELGFGALKVETFSGISAIRATQLGKQLVGKGILTQEEAMELRGMMARGEFDKALDLIDAGAQRAAGKQ